MSLSQDVYYMGTVHLLVMLETQIIPNHFQQSIDGKPFINLNWYNIEHKYYVTTVQPRSINERETNYEKDKFVFT